MTTIIRHVEKADLPKVLDIEQACHAFLDEDFDVERLRPWAWSLKHYISAVRQRKDKSLGTFDTRTLVAEATIGPGIPEVVGVMTYELQPAGYEIVHLAAHPDGPPGVRSDLLWYLVERARRSPKRKNITAFVPDGDWVNLKFYQEQKWTVRRVAEFYEDKNDAWECKTKVLEGFEETASCD